MANLNRESGKQFMLSVLVVANYYLCSPREEGSLSSSRGVKSNCQLKLVSPVSDYLIKMGVEWPTRKVNREWSAQARCSCSCCCCRCLCWPGLASLWERSARSMFVLALSSESSSVVVAVGSGSRKVSSSSSSSNNRSRSKVE